ncbi:MAG: ABC transporter ATP-binding protein [Thermomicrobium sp.]|nr:ABC transporter ATP-binding protein [Thermomicrobium sp.]
MGVRVQGLSLNFGAATILRSVDLVVEDGELFTLLGPSGCGKTTLLRTIAGLERPNAGQIWIDDRLVNDAARGVLVPPEARNVGFVFQSYALWPHMTVAENVAFPLKMRRRPASEIRERVHWALEMVGLAPFASRPVTALSGGQQQRVAIARAIVAQPRLLLMDEPLSNLDADLRREVRDEIRKLQQTLGITTIYVTHDQEEAFAISDRIAVMEAGVVLQVGTPQELYERPAVDFVARFLGQLVVEGTIRTAEERTWIELGGHLVPWDGERLAAGPVRVALDIAKLRLLPPDALDEGRIRLPATLDRLTFAGRWGWRARVRLFDTVSLELYTPHAFAAADRVWVTAEPGFLKLVGHAPTEAKAVRHPA